MADTAFTRYVLRRSGAGGELDYLAAIDTLRELRVPGWQEDEDGRELVFWVPEGASEPEGASPESSSEPERASEPVVAALAPSLRRPKRPAGRFVGGAFTSR